MKAARLLSGGAGLPFETRRCLEGITDAERSTVAEAGVRKEVPHRTEVEGKLERRVELVVNTKLAAHTQTCVFLYDVTLGTGTYEEAEATAEKPVELVDSGERDGVVAAEVGAEVELDAVDVGDEALIGQFSAKGGTGTDADTEGVAVLGVRCSRQRDQRDEGNENLFHADKSVKD